MTAESLALNATPRSREAEAIQIALNALLEIASCHTSPTPEAAANLAMVLAQKALDRMAELLRDGEETNGPV